MCIGSDQTRLTDVNPAVEDCRCGDVHLSVVATEAASRVNPVASGARGDGAAPSTAGGGREGHWACGGGQRPGSRVSQRPWNAVHLPERRMTYAKAPSSCSSVCGSPSRGFDSVAVRGGEEEGTRNEF